MVTSEEIDEILIRMSNDDTIYSASMEQIVMQFLSYKIENVYRMSSIAEIRSNFIDAFSETDTDVPLTRPEFFKYIYTYYLSLETTPKDHFVTLTLDAAKDIQEINQRIKEYEQQLLTIRNNQPSDFHYKIKQFNHIIEKLKHAKYEIADYIANDVKKLSLKKARAPWLGSLVAYHWDYHYKYKHNKDNYTPLIFSDIANKFRDLPVSKYQEIISMYEQSPADFFDFVSTYIQDKNIVHKINKMLTNNHHLIIRNSIIQQSLEAYNNNNKALFSHVIPVQIEGIIFDYCLEIGISYKQIDNVSWEDKFKIIKDRDEDFPHFEYYAYKFPLIRNKVAHGRQLVQKETEYTILADLLLLDLFSVCSLLYSDKLEINKVRSILDTFSLANDRYSKSTCAIEYVFYYSKTNIPNFYYKSILIKENLLNYIQSDDFWVTVDYYLSFKISIINYGLLKVFKVIKGLGISVDKSTQYIKDISRIKVIDNEAYKHFQYEYDNEDLFISLIKFRNPDEN